MNQSSHKASSFAVLISVFFFFGFLAASNDILIPVFKDRFNQEQWQSQLISVAFYIAYTVGSLIYYFFSKRKGGDVLNSMGYKNGIALGLSISALGAFMMFPAAEIESFALTITGLFVIGLGFSLVQIAANPMVIVFGDPKKSSQRLSMAGGLNSLAGMTGPIIFSLAIFGGIGSDVHLDNLDAIKMPYITLGIAFLVVAFLFKLSSLPNRIESGESKPDYSPQQKPEKSIFAYPHLLLGMLAIFVYVGVEVSTASNLPAFMKEHAGIDTNQSAPFISLYWASLMIGRWTASVGALNLKSGMQNVLRFLMPYIAFAVFLTINAILGHDVTSMYFYGAVIVLMIIGDLLSKGSPSRQLIIFSALGIASLIVGMLTKGMISVYAFISVGLYCSTLWPCIFTLAIKGLGKHTNEGSSLLIMMIFGGGIISLIQGFLAKDNLLGIQYSYVVGVLCFAYLGFYGWKAAQILKKQGYNDED